MWDSIISSCGGPLVHHLNFVKFLNDDKMSSVGCFEDLGKPPRGTLPVLSAQMLFSNWVPPSRAVGNRWAACAIFGFWLKTQGDYINLATCNSSCMLLNDEFL